MHDEDKAQVKDDIERRLVFVDFANIHFSQRYMVPV